MEKVRYMISDAASIVNVESHVLRYWEDELELDIPRNEMGHRYYTNENIQEFQRIKELKEQGYQLKAIRMIVHNGPLDGLTGEPAVGQAKLAGGENARPAAAEPSAGPAAGTTKPVSSSGQSAGGPAETQQETPARAAGVQQETAGKEPRAASSGQQKAGTAEHPAQGKKDAAGQAGRMLGRQAAGLKQPGKTEKLSPLKDPGNPIFLGTISDSGRQMTAGDVYAAGKQLMERESEEPVTGLEIVGGSAPVPGETRQSILDNTDKMAQFTDLMTQIVGKALAANNRELSQNISEDVGKQVIKEMNYLMREREELDEDRFRRLDAAIRGNLRKKDEEKGLFKRKKKAT